MMQCLKLAVSRPPPSLRSSSSSALRPKPLSSSSSSPPSCIEYTPWSGLQTWRESSLNHDRFWGPNGPQPLPKPPPPSLDPKRSAVGSASSLAEMGVLVLSASDPASKSELSHLAYCRWRSENLPVGVSRPPDRPARPAKPELVSPKDIPHPKESGLPLNAYMLHTLAHVELNAIDLAWDTVVRFSPFLETLGEGFFADFARVADDESRHYAWCSQRLLELGFRYGDMPAHNLLWRECEKSSDNVAARLAVIPLVQEGEKKSVLHLDAVLLTSVLRINTEARGLDAGPRLVQKLVGFGDNMTSKIVGRIADEETAHVAVGVDWFISICRQMNRAPCSTFKDILREYGVELKGPFNYSARDEAGIPRDWYTIGWLTSYLWRVRAPVQADPPDDWFRSGETSYAYDRSNCLGANIFDH